MPLFCCCVLPLIDALLGLDAFTAELRSHWSVSKLPLTFSSDDWSTSGRVPRCCVLPLCVFCFSKKILSEIIIIVNIYIFLLYLIDLFCVFFLPLAILFYFICNRFQYRTTCIVIINLNLYLISYILITEGSNKQGYAAS